MMRIKALALLAAYCLCITPALSEKLYKLKEFKPDVSYIATSYSFPFLANEIVAESYDANGHPGYILVASDSADNFVISTWQSDVATPVDLVDRSKARSVSIARIDDTHFITPIIDGDNKLRVMLWKITGNGTITYRGFRSGPEVTEVTSASSGSAAMVVAQRKNGTLFAQAFKLKQAEDIPTEKALHRRGIYEFAGNADQLALSDGTANLLAFRDSDGKLRITRLRKRQDATVIERGPTWVAGAIQKATITAADGSPNGRWITLTTSEGPSEFKTGHRCLGQTIHKEPHGRGKLIEWDIGTDGTQFLRRGADREFQGSGGVAKEVAVEVIGNGNYLVSSHLGFDTFCKRNPKNRGKQRMEVHLWDHAGTTYDKDASGRINGKYYDVSIAEFHPIRNYDANFVVALIGENQQVKLSIWGVK
ncbi:hypothetical protein SAMN05444141_104303 [Pseudovibrio denitrificans]|uniref:Uncharacterized protein n=1 Tax=Pseudovibrio denitrificans TaxID=258256 RepID=A0A1I7BTH3_9HYPH|nr:hypothetical protein [Pseudovibrio denitrificans]SFT90423.1 hypothetical protein SAMN05444141_104303 [Pseudovibrio denitrificans]